MSEITSDYLFMSGVPCSFKMKCQNAKEKSGDVLYIKFDIFWFLSTNSHMSNPTLSFPTLKKTLQIKIIYNTKKPKGFQNGSLRNTRFHIHRSRIASDLFIHLKIIFCSCFFFFYLTVLFDIYLHINMN